MAAKPMWTVRAGEWASAISDFRNKESGKRKVSGTISDLMVED